MFKPSQIKMYPVGAWLRWLTNCCSIPRVAPAVVAESVSSYIKDKSVNPSFTVTVNQQVVGAKYNGEGPSIPEDCPVAISRLMKSCWSNLPADRPSFDKVVDTLEANCL